MPKITDLSADRIKILTSNEHFVSCRELHTKILLHIGKNLVKYEISLQIYPGFKQNICFKLNIMPIIGNVASFGAKK